MQKAFGTRLSSELGPSWRSDKYLSSIRWRGAKADARPSRPPLGDTTMFKTMTAWGRPQMVHNLMQPSTPEPENFRNAPRCQARTRAKMSCRSPAVSGKRVCRMHGGTSPGAPKGERNGRWRTGAWTREARALRAEAAWLLDILERSPGSHLIRSRKGSACHG